MVMQKTADSVHEKLRKGGLTSQKIPISPTALPWKADSNTIYLTSLFLLSGIFKRCEPREFNCVPQVFKESAFIASESIGRENLDYGRKGCLVNLLRHFCIIEGLLGTKGKTNAWKKAACGVDLMGTHILKSCLLQAVDLLDDKAEKRLRSFQKRATELGIYGGPPAEYDLEKSGIAPDNLTQEERHRMKNAADYFLYADGMSDVELCDRLHSETAMKKGVLHYLVGPAGAGKSCWAEKALDPDLRVASDEVRGELTGDPADQSQNYLVFQKCADRIRNALHEGKTVVFDATNLNEKYREVAVKTARWSAAAIHSYFFDIDIRTAKERNIMRSRHVPTAVIERHFRELDLPKKYEADYHHVVSKDGQCRRYWP